MNPYNKSKDLIKSPTYSSAPNVNLSVPIPSFSSAPDFSSPKEKKQSGCDKSPHSSPARHRSRHDRSRSPARHRQRSRSPHRSRRNSRPPRDKKNSSRHPKSSQARKRTPSPEVVHTGALETGLTFVMDRRGDSDNIKYGGNHSYSVPTYKRSGDGRVLGLSPNTKIDSSVVKAGTVTLIDRSKLKSSRYADSSYAWNESDKDLKRIRVKPKVDEIEKDPFAVHDSFISFDDTTSTTKQNVYESYLSSGVDYRSIEGNKVKKHTEQESEEEEEGESVNDMIRRRTIEYNRQLDQEPKNVQLWLEFIKFQDQAATDSTKSNKASINEVKLSIFEKALDQNPTNIDLIHAYLQCGAETWDTIKLLREWDYMLKQHPGSIELWSDYINLRQTNFASFTFSQCVKVFEDALATLGRRARRKELDYDTREDIESLMVYILLRACLFMKQSGYHEKAFALIQAAAEFNLYQPDIHLPYESKVEAFTDFWDKEVLRFGEKGAFGWRAFYAAPDKSGEVVTTNTIMKQENQDEITTIKDWYYMEMASEQTERLPLRMNQVEDDSMDEDPYRITLSDDVKPFLFNTSTAGARHHLIYSIFVCLGLPYTPPQVGTNTHFFTDTFTHNDLPLQNFWPPKERSSKHLVWYVTGVPMNPGQTADETNPYYIPNSYPLGIDELFAKSGSWFKASGKEFMPKTVDEEFTRNVFQQLLAVEKSEHLRICYLAFESSCEYKMGRRLAKSLLKEKQTSLTLWNAYAQMEKSHGRIDEARKVYLTALSSYHTFPKSEQIYAPSLYFMFAKLELEENKPAEACKILVSMASDTPYNDDTQQPNPVLILKSREYFSQKLAQISILSEDSTEREIAKNIVGCAALFEYLSSGLDDAIAIYQRTLNYIKGRQAKRGYESEMIWIEYARLLYHYSKYMIEGGYKPSLLRNTMEEAIGLFPNNTMFISFYIWNESKTKLFNRVNNLLNSLLLKESNVVLWLSAIYSELHKCKPYQVNAIRDFFERSITDTRTRSSIILWKCFIQFEINENNLVKAKNSFYRSIRECPWAKELYLIGIKEFSGTMNDNEINELVSLMMEKEIRLRNPIENDLLP